MAIKQYAAPYIWHNTCKTPWSSHVTSGCTKSTRKFHSRTAFLAVRSYLNHIPKGLRAAREKLGAFEAEKLFSRLKVLMESDELCSADVKVAAEIINTLYECEKG